MTKRDYQLICGVAKKAHPVFVANNWTYWDGVPSVDRLVGVLCDLWFSLETSPYDAISSGRFRLFREEDGQIDIVLEVGSTLDCD